MFSIESKVYCRAVILLVYLPLFHLAIASSISLDLDLLTWQKFSFVAFRLWAISACVYLLVRLLVLLPFKLNKLNKYIKFVMLYYSAALISITGFWLLTDAGLNNKTVIGPFVVALFEVLLFAVVNYIIEQNKRAASLEKNVKAAQYQTLKARLNPHFLFNTLNHISADILTDPENASDMVDELADLFRAVLNNSANSVITLKDEISLIEHYLSLEKHRFDNRFDYSITVDPMCNMDAIPPMTIQTFVENCITHAFKNQSSGGQLTIIAQVVENKLRIQIEDNGCGFEPVKTSYREGIKIVNDSLALFYEDNYLLDIASKTGKGTTITVLLPRNV